MKGRCVDVPVSERQIRLMINENDVHVVAHLFDGTVDLGQLLRVRPFTAWQHTTHGDRRGHRFRFMHEKFDLFFNFVGWHISHHFTGAAHDHYFRHVEVVVVAYLLYHVADVFERGPRFPADGDRVNSHS